MGALADALLNPNVTLGRALQLGAGRRLRTGRDAALFTRTCRSGGKSEVRSRRAAPAAPSGPGGGVGRGEDGRAWLGAGHLRGRWNYGPCDLLLADALTPECLLCTWLLIPQIPSLDPPRTTQATPWLNPLPLKLRASTSSLDILKTVLFCCRIKTLL